MAKGPDGIETTGAPTLHELIELLRTLEWPDEQFAMDLEEIQAQQELQSTLEEWEECTPLSSSDETP